ncbi:hypothetical protein QQS21_003836 [Conoideocrella luteorostrata]|uniref:Cytochrome P450 n=1 Tax=Conoideocrella luteorostrata TaxID=1105319 RepID=A0AAJ0FW18_9HYPO|nr:hypothetical protein QQS21_003836 [Conoideocrella luteorostrata]
MAILLDRVTQAGGQFTVPFVLLGLSVLFIVYSRTCRAQVPTLTELVPLYNTYQYLTDVGTFMDRVTETLNAHKSNLVKFRIGFRDAYIVTGPKNVQKVFGPPNVVDGNFIQLILMDKHWGMTKDEIGKFANDKSGRLKDPAPGKEGTPESHRYWLGHDRLYADFLTKRHFSDSLAASFYKLFSQRLDQQPLNEWRTVSLFDLLKTGMAEAAVVSLFGSKIIELNDGFTKAYWDFDHIAGTLVWGLPNWMRPGPVRKHTRLHEMTRKHIDSAWEHFNWDGPEAETDWEPHFGSRLSRETAKWLREKGMSNHAIAGHTLASLFGLNGNTVPVTAWALMEIIKDKDLFNAVRQDALPCFETNQETGERSVDAQELISSPLLQSIYVETMRLHVSFNVSREVLQDIEIDGVIVGKGSLLQSSSQIAHYEEDVWAVEGHPASEFFARRHIKYVSVEDDSGHLTKKEQFSMKGRPSSFFPYGGGYVMCPGRHFAKQEIIMAIATIVTKFDVDFVEWVNEDGTKSDRPAQDDKRYAGFIAMSPDREMKIRWARRH